MLNRLDITFKTSKGRFNYRVSAITIYENKLLVMKDECSSYFYLPGGGVNLHKTAERAVLREIKDKIFDLL